MRDDARQLLLDDVRGKDMASLVSRNHTGMTTALDRIISSLNSSASSFNNFIPADSDNSIG